MKKLQLLAIATLISINNTLECSQFYKPSKKITAYATAFSTASLGGYYGYNQYQTNETYKQTLATFNKLGVKYSNEVTAQDHNVTNLTKKHSSAIENIITNQNMAIVRHKLYTADQINRIQKKFINSDDNGLRKDIKLEKINDIKGHGAVATRNIPQDSLIGIYTGIVRHYTEIEDASYAFDCLYLHNYRPGCHNLVVGEMQIDASESGNITRFLNAPSDAPEGNCNALNVMDKNGMPQVLYVTNQEIKAGEELTIGYGPKYRWKHDKV